MLIPEKTNELCVEYLVTINVTEKLDLFVSLDHCDTENHIFFNSIFRLQIFVELYLHCQFNQRTPVYELSLEITVFVKIWKSQEVHGLMNENNKGFPSLST